MNVRSENLQDHHQMCGNILPNMTEVIDVSAIIVEKNYSRESSFGTNNMQDHLKLRFPKYKNIVAREDKKQKVLVNAKITNICAPGSLIVIGFNMDELEKNVL